MSHKATAAMIAVMGIACLFMGCQRPACQSDAQQGQGPTVFTEQFVVPMTNSEIVFDMILVPGDAEQAIQPYYISKHEVTWQMLYDWMYCSDIKSPQEAWALIDQGLRPSPLQELLATTFQVYENDMSHPALGMTCLTAKSYCIWLSERTGRQYRLPTLREWRHAAELGGGLPPDFDQQVLHRDNAPQPEPHFVAKTLPVASKEANALGIHNLFGSVAEWVTSDQGPDLIVGGSINNPPAEISAHWQAEENIDIWSASYPQLPYSRFWYMDYYYSGIRLVCEPKSVVANPLDTQ